MTSSAGIIIKLYGRVLFFSPVYIPAFYKSGNRTEHLQAGKAAVYLITGKFNSEFSYTLEIGENFKEGILGFAAAGYF